MAKPHANLKTPKNSDDLILIAGVLLLLAGSYMFFTYDNSQRAADATPTSAPTAAANVSASPAAQALEVCAKNGTAFKMGYEQARTIALNSECTQNGSTLGTEHWCNEITGTWWIRTSIKKEGCNPACVVNVETQEAEINWMCTGLRTG